MAASDVDPVSRALGSFGPWQAQGILLLALIKIPAGWHMLSILFTAPQPKTIGGTFWCARPSPAWSVERWSAISHTTKISLSGERIYDACKIYDVEYPISPPLLNTSLEPYNTSVTTPCDTFEFSQDYPTLVSQWEMVCSREVLVNVTQLAYLLGILFGGLVTALLLKRISPREVLLGGAMLQIISGVISAYVSVFEIHALFKFLTGLGACLMFSAGFQICGDITGGWQKTVVSVSYEHFWSIGVISLGWLSDLARSWVNLQLIISVPTALIFLLAWWIPDSPRWLIANGKTKEAEVILRVAAAVNSRTLPVDFKIETSSSANPAKSSSRLPRVKVTMLLVLWVITVYNYYGALLNIRNTGGPRLPIRTSLAGVAEVMGATMGMILLLKYSPARRFLCLSFLLALGGAACVSSWALPPLAGGGRGGWNLLILALVGRVSISCSLAVLSCGGSAELLPVSRRPFTMLCLVSIARLGLQSAPFMNSLAAHGESVTLSVYGSLTLLGAMAALYLALDLAPPCSYKNKLNGCNRRVSNMISSARPSVWTVNRTEISTLYEEKVIGIYFNDCFVPDHRTTSQA